MVYQNLDDMAKKVKKSGVFTKYDYVPGNYRVISEETLTVPDLVLSMAEIYRKYAVTGDISSLPGKVRPNYVDDGDEFEDAFESEEMTDTLLYARDIRDRVSAEAEQAEGKSYTKKTPARPAEEDSKENSDAQSASTKTQPQENGPSDHNDAAERSESKE